MTLARHLRNWIRDEPESRLAPTAVSLLFRVERDRGSNLGSLRTEFTDLDERYAQDCPALVWEARKASARCLFNQQEFAAAIDEFRDIREDAPDEVEALLIDIAIMQAEELLSGNVDAIGSNDAKISSIFKRIECPCRRFGYALRLCL